MNKYLFLVLAIFTCGNLQAGVIKDVNEFQSEIEKCVTGKAPAECLNKLLAGTFPPGNEAMNAQIQQVTKILDQWLSSSSVYKIHLVKQTKVGDIADNRYYAVESSSGGFMVLEIQYVWLLGNPYLLTFNVSSTSDTIDALLSGRL